MSEEGAGPAGWPVAVRVPVQADARDAAARSSALAVRGPLFGVAAQDQDRGGGRWRRVAVEVTHACPQ
ncbi:DUF5954 family protein [Streptomyces sp. NPDC056480]|uniref:DUF5954 family protein n=1 Tax=Streptomyces sp. NPDC056480 TaxID=3345833 RepID=UPI0036873AEB